MAGRSPQRYTAEFKRDAVALVVSSGRPIKVVSRELGVSDTTLGNWVRADAGASRDKKGDGQEMDEEKRQLRRRVAELEKEREILKRALAFWVNESNA